MDSERTESAKDFKAGMFIIPPKYRSDFSQMEAALEDLDREAA